MPNPMEDHLKPNRKKFEEDPFGYSALAWHQWAVVQEVSGFPVDLENGPSSEDLKSPVLWLMQAHAMSEAGLGVLKSEPTFDQMPELLRGACDSQYCAVGLMLVGFSLEICLKAMTIIKLGVEQYTEDERMYRHHKLEKLATFVPDLSLKDKAILSILTHFVTWAGRYSDPGSGREDDVEEIFSISEKHEVCAKDLFDLSARVMKQVGKIVGD